MLFYKPLVSKPLSLIFQNTSPEDLEKKRANSSAYRNFLNREGPRALGSKEVPQVKTPKPLMLTTEGLSSHCFL